MPIKIPKELPAKEILESEKIFAIEDESAQLQHIRPLKVVILNLMPKKIETETAKKISYIKELEQMEPAKKIDIIIHWTNGSIYGWQASAEMNIETAENWNHYEGSKTSGCGYDKRSTASAEVLNRSKNIFV